MFFYADSFGDINFLVDDGTSFITLFTSGLLDGNWHQITGVRNGSTFELYADGALVDSGTASIGSISNSENLILGATDASNSDYDGLIDDVRLYDQVITPADILQLATGGEPAQTVPGPQFITENETLTFSAANGNAITVSDTGPADTRLQVFITVNDGILTLSQTAGSIHFRWKQRQLFHDDSRFGIGFECSI